MPEPTGSPAPREPRPQDGVTEAPPVRALDDRRIRAAFFDLFGRPPLTAEREEWGGRALAELLEAHLGGPEFWDNWLEEQLWYFLLVDNFRPESERVAAIPGDLAAGRLDFRDAIHRVCLSSSFDLRNPGADTFVSVVMEQLLGVVVQDERRELEIGKGAYDGREGRFLGTMASSQSDVVAIAMADRRFLERFIEREHLRLLRAPLDRRAVKDLARALDKAPWKWPEVLEGWLRSLEWDARLGLRRPLSNRAWVRAVHVDLCDRLPAEDEARRMRDALDGLSDPTPLRGLVARLMLDGGHTAVDDEAAIDDQSAWVAGWFLRLLGRPPSADEARAFVHALRDPAGRPTTIVYALASSAEYQED